MKLAGLGTTADVEGDSVSMDDDRRCGAVSFLSKQQRSPLSFRNFSMLILMLILTLVSVAVSAIAL